MVADAAFSHKVDYVTTFVGDSKSRKASKLQYWFKSLGDFAELPIGGASSKGSAPAACRVGLYDFSQKDIVADSKQ